MKDGPWPRMYRTYGKMSQHELEPATGEQVHWGTGTALCWSVRSIKPDEVSTALTVQRKTLSLPVMSVYPQEGY